MSNISIFKNENLKKEFTDGFCTVRILEETCPEVSIELCTLKAGAAKDFETYSFEDRMQIFTFTSGNGMIKAGKSPMVRLDWKCWEVFTVRRMEI